MDQADSDYYNVTVNFIMMRKGSKAGHKEQPNKVQDLDLGSTSEEEVAEVKKADTPASKFDVNSYI